jgi:hypothetical protein
LPIFKYRVLFINQLLISIIQLFIVFEDSWESETLMVKLVSSVKRIGLDVSEMDFGVSLIQNKKSRRLSMEPGGAPSLTGSHLENYCLSLLSIITLLKLVFK